MISVIPLSLHGFKISAYSLDTYLTFFPQGRNVLKGTFLLLVIKGKNKRGTMKIKENKQ